MKASPLQTKRCASKGRFRLLHARTARRKQRVAAAGNAAQLDSDEPNLSVARALVVILLIHIVAIGGIFIHNRFFDGTAALAETDSGTAVPAAQVADEPLPRVREGESHYVVQTGDNYAEIAAAQGVSEDDLRRLNDNIPVRAGRILKMPGRRAVALEPAEMERLRAATRVEGDRGLIERAGIATTAVLVRPNIGAAEIEAAPRATIVEPAASSATHTVVAGDTFWRIANQYQVTPEALMALNGINDPRKLKPGMKLKIPAR